jgi:hypothetical protein
LTDHSDILDEMLHDFYVNNNPVARLAWLDYHTDHGLSLPDNADRIVTRTTTALWHIEGPTLVLAMPIVRVVFQERRVNLIEPGICRWYCCNNASCRTTIHLPPYLLNSACKEFSSVRAANAWLSRTAILWAYFTARPHKRPKE